MSGILQFNQRIIAQTKFDTVSFKFSAFGKEKKADVINLHLVGFKYGNFPASKIGMASGALGGFALGYFGSLNNKKNFLGPTTTGAIVGLFGLAVGGLIGATLDEFGFIY